MWAVAQASIATTIAASFAHGWHIVMPSGGGKRDPGTVGPHWLP